MLRKSICSCLLLRSLLLLLPLFFLFSVESRRKCFRRMRGTRTFVAVSSLDDQIDSELQPIEGDTEIGELEEEKGEIGNEKKMKGEGEDEEEQNQQKQNAQLQPSIEHQKSANEVADDDETRQTHEIPQFDEQKQQQEQDQQSSSQRRQQPAIVNTGVGSSIRPAIHEVYLWPSMTDHEKAVVRDAFHQIHRRTCIRFIELDYKPWYHAERWTEGKPYVVIRKSKKFSGYSDNNIEGVNRRSLIYLSEQSMNSPSRNNSRGMVMEQLLKFMGFREEFLRPDAPSYIQPIRKDSSSSSSSSNQPQLPTNSVPKFSNEQLMWPFDPESISVPNAARDWFKLTIYCQARRNADIGAGQRAGLLTRWDAVKLNSMYCPQSVGYADPRMGPCVMPRKPKI